MQKLMNIILDKITQGQTFSENDDEMLLYAALLVVQSFALVAHVFLLLVMIILRVPPLIFVSCISVSVYLVLFVLVFKYRKYKLAVLATTIEVILFATISTAYMGGECFFILYLFLILLVQLNVPYAKTNVLAGTSLLIFVGMLTSVLISALGTPLFQVASQDSITFMAIFNSVACFVGTLIEILALNIIRTSNIERVRRFEKRAHTDSLTGINNRWYADGFISSFDTESDITWCVAMLDVDNFKRVNDTFGHPVGDAVLIALADTLLTSFRKTDVLFRWGGEEFLIFLYDINLQTATKILDSVRKKIAESIVTCGDTRLNYTVTIGVAEVNSGDIQGSIAACDERLYHGKQSGKNKIVS